VPLRTLFLNPPSFENFDGGAASRWPATREVESYWYPVWLAYPAGMLEGSRLLDAPPNKISADETARIASNYELLVLFTSTRFCKRYPFSPRCQGAKSKYQDCFCWSACDGASREIARRLPNR
jgi:hypothetical protein